MDKIEFLSDEAIRSRELDKFNRNNFVESVANIIYSQSTAVNADGDSDYKNVEENLVIGIFGEWGLGKSSILNLLNEVLIDKGLRTIYFNPWMYNNEEQLVASLFNNIIKNVDLEDSIKDNLINFFKKYLPLVSIAFPGASQVGNAIINSVEADEDTIDAFYCKSKIDEILSGTANPLIIFIDDVDRLSKDEIHVLFKTLRLIASFRHVIYVVACDFEMVAKSIKENYVDGDIEDGRAFIEKIIQIPIRIPELKSDQLLSYGVDLISKTSSIDMSTSNLFKVLFERYFYTPRDVKRFVNGLRFTHSYLKGVIPDEELIILELIRVKVHSLYHIIKIYYRAIGAIDTDTYYSTEFIHYVTKHRKDFFNSEGHLDHRNKEFKIYTDVFKALFKTNDIVTLKFTSTKNPINKSSGYKQIMQEGYRIRNNDLSNPEKLVEYFEKLPETPEH